MRFIDQFDVVLLDLCSTFMFGTERYLDHAEQLQRYRQLGGRLSDAELHQLMGEFFAFVDAEYHNPQLYDDFPRVRELLRKFPATAALSGDERVLIEAVFAQLEVGVISPAYAQTLRTLAQTHRLGVVSNTWSESVLYRQAFAAAGVTDLFGTLIFSTDHGPMKPSPKIFQRALQNLSTTPERAVLVGDSLRCDIGGARATGLKCVWVNAKDKPLPSTGPQPDRIVRTIHELPTLE